MSRSTCEVSQYLPFHRPSIEQEEIDAMVDVLKTGWLTAGPKVREFEEAFAQFVGARHALAVSSCTAALHLALDAIGLEEGDEVLLPALTFTATAEVVTYLRAKPVLIDSEACYFTLDPNRLEESVTPRTRAIIPVHFAGHPCDMESLMDIASRNNLTIVEDAAHAFPAKYRHRNIGTLGRLTAFSFYATKTLSTGEGGMITTEDDSLASYIEMMRLHGMSKDAWKRYSAEGSWRYDVVEAGYKYNLTDMQAALGLVQLRKAEAMRRERARIAALYTRGLAQSHAFRLPEVSPEVQHAWHLYVILLQPGSLTIHRDVMIEELRRRGIGTAVHFIPLNLHSYYQTRWGYRRGDFPVAEDYAERCLSLPLYPSMTAEDVDRVIESLNEIAYKYRT